MSDTQFIVDSEGNVIAGVTTEEWLPKSRFIDAIGYISAELASRSDAWNGNHPAWFPEPPEWLVLADEAIRATEPDLNIELLGNPDAQVWARIFVDIVHNNPSIAFDEETMTGWFANAIGTGEMFEQQRQRELTLIDRIAETLLREEERLLIEGDSHVR